jgi:hypothetical protein
LRSESKENKILFVTRCLPYEIGGTPVGVRNLLQNFDPKKIIVLGRTVNPKKKLEKDSIKYKMYEIPTPQGKGMRLWRFLSVIPGFIIGLNVIRKHKIKKLIGVYPDEGSLLLGYLLSVFTKVDFYPYFFDLYSEFKRNNWQDKVAKWLQRKSFKKAKKIICLTDGMKAFYKENYNLTAYTIPNVINQKINNTNTFNTWNEGEKFRIGYSGAINRDRLDTLQVFFSCIKDNPKYEMVYFTSQSEEYLRKNDVFGENAIIKFCTSQAELLKELQNCHLLYLPLSFNNPPEILLNMMTCFGTKTYEYLIAGCPTLVHSPSNFFNYTFLKENACAYTLSANTENEVERYISELIKGYNETAPKIVSKAYETAAQFRGTLVSEKLMEIVGEK